MKIALAYFIIISLIGIFMTVKDKSAAVKGSRRVPEKTLIIIGLTGAALPMFLTMQTIRHKTKRMKFMLGLPAEVLLHIIIICAAVYLKAK